MSDLERWASLGTIEIPINLVLVVDDDPQDAAAIRQTLEQRQITVRVVKDGGQAQATFALHKPDFVILDLILPGESGFEICERLKHCDPGIPVLIYSAIDRADARELARRVGADGYLTKPLPSEELMQAVRQVAETVWERTHLLGRSADSERIRFQCRCGKKFKVSASHQGKGLSCPQCGEPLIVPKQSATV